MGSEEVEQKLLKALNDLDMSETKKLEMAVLKERRKDVKKVRVVFHLKVPHRENLDHMNFSARYL